MAFNALMDGLEARLEKLPNHHLAPEFATPP